MARNRAVVEHLVYSLLQLERVELLCRSSKITKLIGGRCYHRKRERGKRSSEQGVQILHCTDADSDVRAVILSGVSGEIGCDRVDRGLVDFGLVGRRREGGSSARAGWRYERRGCIHQFLLQPDQVGGRLDHNAAKADL